MKFTKEAFIAGFALFALFFGAGNLILPPFLGFFAGSAWYLVALGFVVSAVGFPLMGIFAHARLQGSIYNFADKVSPNFSLVFCIIIYSISVALPAPRTAAVTHEIAVLPFFEVSALATSCIYFTLVFLFVIKRSAVVNNLAKFLTPAILLLLLAIIIRGIFFNEYPTGKSLTNLPALHGFFEGYQTFDAIAALVVGGVIIISVKIKGITETIALRKTISIAAIIAACGLLFVYGGLIYNGAAVKSEFALTVSRSELLHGISYLNLGPAAGIGLSILVSLACFTTAVGIITGTADFMAERVKGRFVYPLTVGVACSLGVIMGALSVNAIIEIALPILMLVYPLTIVLIILNVLRKDLRTPFIMRVVVFTTIIFSLPDSLTYILPTHLIAPLQAWIPFSKYGLGWVIPAGAALLFARLYQFYVLSKT